MPPAHELRQPGALLGREHLGNVRQGSDQALGRRLRQLQFRMPDVPQCRTINARLRQCLEHRLLVLVMLLAHWHQVLHSRLDNRFDLLTLFVTGINTAQYPIRRELEARPHHVWIIGSVPPRAAGTVSGPEPPARAWLCM